MHHLDTPTVKGFGDEWTRFDQAGLSPEEHRRLFERYFHLFPWAQLPPNATGLDAGCGSGRWACLVAPRVGTLHCVDASEQALRVAQRNLKDAENVRLHCASLGHLPLAPKSLDFCYCLGVLHHVPDPAASFGACVRTLKPGAPMLIYVYYALANRPWWYRALWLVSDGIRRLISRLPRLLVHLFADGVALALYFPLSRAARFGEGLGLSVSGWPLSSYRRCSVYTLRTDALDRFGTRLEHRFTREEVIALMEEAGLERITVMDGVPYWCATGYRRSPTAR